TGCSGSDDRGRTTEDRQSLPHQFPIHATRPSTECASSSRCQRSEDTKDRRQRTDILLRRPSGLPNAQALFESAKAKLIRSHRKDVEAFRPLPSVLREWWSQTGSNRRPHACKARALPTELWPRRREAASEVGNRKSEN